ncbi:MULTISPECIES: GNAT family N-acetyltransferase [unclassified Streptomyces]|uniref:GNAT family N-acetyltransferase n=1 Tax=unclassified Streptomyces TaxID=2593676 RepID=UPI002E76E23D|nr:MULTISPECIES: GNAT family N-acetyltransferase [unclassified Streptomyces]MEE1764946.1 GNAT family N-acetyltransferase [Streptomyces sp. SP18BB07]MEE1831639.1 GNAT family N-acetyltransferase [Streptomyces sp. SP17KL33]
MTAPNGPRGTDENGHWHVTGDVDDFLARAGDFLRSRPAPHTVQLTVTETLRTFGADAYGAEAPVLGRLERAGEVRATFFRTPPHRLNLTPLTPGEADALAARLAGPRDRERLVRWYDEFAAAVGEAPSGAAAARFAEGRVTLWETPDGVPVSMAAVTPVIAGQVRVAAVYTPARLRGRGYAGAVTAEVSRAASAAGAQQVLLFTNLDNTTSNALYVRLGYRPVDDFTVYDFAPPTR